MFYLPRSAFSECGVVNQAVRLAAAVAQVAYCEPCITFVRILPPLLLLQSTGLVRHVFRLLAQAKADHRAVPWVLLENVSVDFLMMTGYNAGQGTC